ncbi:iron-containing redox enzyme family protein [Rhodospirillaceae bacterium KN72]|uniref:Iron-containing redox enzyme family protein n=1 Tax=Pacificispira spongiicola TaxID=2729598 RepID=A0A7Y0HEH9_9PROT|nr:iron-containing redox enzyme family protein [Pacificispira spongiicola]NMM43583.1 iron-containing redox enzyme family protein [Pacificispira spongiicola]
MTNVPFYDRLLQQTEAERLSFQSIPVIQAALAGRIDRDLYIAYLGEAYHHVRHTCPLLATALGRCRKGDKHYREALLEYLEEERGHEDWILNDIAALGGDAEAVAAGDGSPATRIMVGYAYYMIDRISPYALLGMVHVLEGMSVALADKAAAGIAAALTGPDGSPPTGGFSYLLSHGSLDQDHVRFFESLVNALPDAKAEAAVVEAAKLIYRLFGDIFRDLTPKEVLNDAA